MCLYMCVCCEGWVSSPQTRGQWYSYCYYILLQAVCNASNWLTRETSVINMQNNNNNEGFMNNLQTGESHSKSKSNPLFLIKIKGFLQFCDCNSGNTQLLYSVHFFETIKRYPPCFIENLFLVVYPLFVDFIHFWALKPIYSPPDVPFYAPIKWLKPLPDQKVGNSLFFSDGVIHTLLTICLLFYYVELNVSRLQIK